MPWWSGLDEDVYVSLDEAKARAHAEVGQGNAQRLPALEQHLTRPTAVLARDVA